MKRVCLAITRFRNDKKEAISKNFINLAEVLSEDNTLQITTLSPTPFGSEKKISQIYFDMQQDYASLSTALKNLFKVCRYFNNNRDAYDVISIHVASPVEAFIIFLLLPETVLKRTSLSLWQSYLTFNELKGNASYFLKNIKSYKHILVANSFISAALYRFCLTSFKTVIVHNSYQKNLIQFHTRKPLIYIPNAVFPSHQIQNRHFNIQKYTFLYIGHTKASKGVDIVLELVAELRKSINLELVLAASGFGGMHETIEQIKQLNLTDIVIRKDEIDVRQELLTADILIVPLRTCVGTSLSPNVIVEAISLGTPVITSAFPELKELLGDQQLGLTVDVTNIKKSTTDILAFLKDTQEVYALSNRQLAFFRKHLTLENFIQSYKSILLNPGK